MHDISNLIQKINYYDLHKDNRKMIIIRLCLYYLYMVMNMLFVYNNFTTSVNKLTPSNWLKNFLCGLDMYLVSIDFVFISWI